MYCDVYLCLFEAVVHLKSGNAEQKVLARLVGVHLSGREGK